jgi:antirestriction protein
MKLRKDSVKIMVKIWVGNLGKYNEAISHGAWLTLPIMHEEDFDEFLKEKCGIGECDEFGQPYEEWHICDVDSDIPGITIGEYASVREIMELSELIEEIESLQDYEYKACLAYMDSWNNDWSEALDIVQRNRYMHLPWIKDYYSLGEYFFEEGNYKNDISNFLLGFFDYEEFGEHMGSDGALSEEHGYFEVRW